MPGRAGRSIRQRAGLLNCENSLTFVRDWRRSLALGGGSGLSSGNHLFPTQVLISATSVVQYKPRWIGRQEEVIHMAHVASVKIDTGLVLSDIEIESSGVAE